MFKLYQLKQPRKCNVLHSQKGALEAFAVLPGSRSHLPEVIFRATEGRLCTSCFPSSSRAWCQVSSAGPAHQLHTLLLLPCPPCRTELDVAPHGGPLLASPWVCPNGVKEEARWLNLSHWLLLARIPRVPHPSTNRLLTLVSGDCSIPAGF